jgi:predicted  nucleic acid-binding Zn-ribbon protein
LITVVIVGAVAFGCLGAIWGSWSDLRYQKSRKERDDARKTGEEIAHRLAECEKLRMGQQVTLSNMTALAKDLETKLRDCTDPPISRDELKALTRALATARAERDALRLEVEKYRPQATA